MKFYLRLSITQMKNTLGILAIFISSLSFSAATHGQPVSDTFCREVEIAVAAPLKPTHWYHNIVFENECSFEFDINSQDWISISLEKSNTEKAARKSLHSNIQMYKDGHITNTGKSWSILNFPRSNFWDEAYFLRLTDPCF